MLTRAAARGAKRPLVVADMPFGSFQVSDEEAVQNAVRFVKEAGADAVKLEGAGPTVSRVLALVGAGIPVMGHVGGHRSPPRCSRLPLAWPHRGEGESAPEDPGLLAGRLFALVLKRAPLSPRVTRISPCPPSAIGSGRDGDGRSCYTPSSFSIPAVVGSSSATRRARSSVRVERSLTTSARALSPATSTLIRFRGRAGGFPQRLESEIRNGIGRPGSEYQIASARTARRRSTLTTLIP